MKKNFNKHFIRQQGQSDCGVACMGAIVRYFGGNVSLEKLRELSGTGKQGTTLLGLYQAAPQVGLDAEAYEADIDNLKLQTTPSILHVVMDNRLQHYVVCYGFEQSSQKFIISDPAKGVVSYTAQELEEIWKSKALLLVKPNQNFVNNATSRTRKWMWAKQLIKEDLNLLGIALFLGVAMAALGMSTAIFSQKLIDDILPSQDLKRLIAGIALLAFLLFVKSGLSFLRQYFLLGQSRDFNIRLIDNFYGRLLLLPKSFFDNRKVGELIARMNDGQRIQQALVYLTSNVMIDFLMVTAGTIAIFVYSASMGLATMLWIPAFFLLVYKFHHPIIKSQQAAMAAYAKNESNYVDTIQGVGTIKLHNKEKLFTQITRSIYGFFQDQVFSLGSIKVKFNFATELLGTVFIVGIIAWSAVSVLNASLTIGGMIAILQMIGIVMPSASNLALTNLQLQEAKVAFDRMFEYTSIDAEYESSIQAHQDESLCVESLVVEEVGFRFPGRSPLLENVSFELQRGQMIAIMGESGSGKTTMLQLMQKFYKPEKGKIKVNGVGLEEIATASWRSKLAVVPQEIKIFNGSLIDNILLGEQVTDPDVLLQFFKEYGFDRYFMALPNGYATLLGEEGVNISGGQRQLVGLARALYKKPQVLLLDEATAAMDRNTQMFVMQLLSSLKGRLSVVLLTHNVKTAKQADFIYILEQRKISAAGTHDQLINMPNLYADGWRDLQLELENDYAFTR